MGRLPRPDPRGVGRRVGAAGAVGFPIEVAQAPARPEEAEAQEAERGQDQTRRHREDPRSSSNVYKMIPPKGWVRCADRLLDRALRRRSAERTLHGSLFQATG